MSQLNAFIPIEPVAPEVEPSPRFGAMREVAPLIDRPAPPVWRALFHRTCAASPDLDWKGAGFVLCNADEVERVAERLRDITHSTNAAFASHLAEAAPEERARLMEEGINFFPTDDSAYRIRFP